jgi:glycosyltransferase involved in cell wall biosynthesis
MRVALVVTEVGRNVGGRFTFQEMLIAATERAEQRTSHTFVRYSSGISRYSEGGRVWRLRRLMQVISTTAIHAWSAAQDELLGKRLVHIPTRLQRRLRRDAIDIVWFPTQYAEEVDLPYISTVLDLAHRLLPWFPEVTIGGEWERRERYFNRYLPKATAVIVTNRAGLDEVERFYQVPRENCITLPHPTPDFALRAADQPARSEALVRNFGVLGSYLLYPAQFWPHKNHAAALDALAELRARGEELSLVFVGSDKGQLAHVREQVRRHGLERAVYFLGFVEDDELVALYQHAVALLYLSRFGPENLPPLEALALGCPAVVGEVHGAREQFGDSALIVDSNDPAAVADAVQRTQDREERQRLIAAGRERAGSWTADDYVASVIAFLDQFERERRLWA